MRTVWAIKGWERPLAHHRTRYEWEYVYGFVHPSTGASEMYLMPSVSTDLMDIALQEFAKARWLLLESWEKDPTCNTHIILLIDQAGFHSLKSLEIPVWIHIFPLPPYSPQLQPVECAWPLLHEPIANRNFPSMDALEEILIERSNYLMQHPETLKWAVGFDWICRIEDERELL